MIIVHLGFPSVEKPRKLLPAIRKRRDKSCSIANIHIQGRIANIGGTVENDRTLYDVVWGWTEPQVQKRIDFMELGKRNILMSTSPVIICITIKRTEVGIERLRRERSIGTIHLQMAVGFIPSSKVKLLRSSIKPRLTEFQINTSADITCCLWIAIKARIQSYALQVTTFYIRRYRIHFIGTSIEYLHTIDSCTQSLGRHIVYHWFPGICASFHHGNIVQLQQMLLYRCSTPLASHLALGTDSRGDSHLVNRCFFLDTVGWQSGQYITII